MLACLPILPLAFLAVAFHRKGLEWRASLLYASIPFSLFLAFITELLTQFRLLTRDAVAVSWLIFAIACFLWMWRIQPVPHPNADVEQQSSPLLWIDRVFLASIVVLATLTALTAVASAPNTWDAMRYHLPRVVEWMNNHGVQFFPTIDRFQLDQAPFGEYAMLHLDLLSGSDRLLGLVQWLGYVGCILGASLVAKEFGGRWHVQIVAAVFAATIPSAVLEASGTKTELVAGYWIVLSVYLLLRWRHSQDWPHALAIGAALGLAIFTKGTSYVFLPCLFLACVVIWSGAERRKFLWRLPVIAGMGVLVCVPLWVRNYQYTGSPLGLSYFDGAGSLQGRMLRNTHITPVTIVANMARNVALHVGTPSNRINAVSSEAFSGFIRSIGANPDDPTQLSATSFGNLPRFAVRYHPRYEVLAGDPLPMLLLLLAGVLLIAYRRRMGKEAGWLWLGLLGAFILDSALLRWSQWNARYEIPIFAVGAAVCAMVLVRALPQRVVNAIAVLAILLALPLALANETRPLITRHGLAGSVLTTPRDETYFFDFHRKLAPSFIAAAAAARASSCRSFGLDADKLHFEYPMMALLTGDGVPRRIRYVGVENSSVRYEHAPAQPVCMIICLNCLNDAAKMAAYGRKFRDTQSFGNVVLFRQASR